MEGTANREMVSTPLPPPEEGQVEDLLFRFVLVPKTSIKERFPQSLGLKKRRVVNRASWDHFPPPLPGVLLPNRGNPRHGCTGTELAPGPAQICVPPSVPTSTDTVQDQGG